MAAGAFLAMEAMESTSSITHDQLAFSLQFDFSHYESKFNLIFDNL